MLRDMRDEPNKVMGGILMLLTGDPRQCLPIVVGGTRADQVNATLPHSQLWAHVKKLHLTKNMRASGDETFATVLEDIGNGVLGKETEGVLRWPVEVNVKDRNSLIDEIVPYINDNLKNPEWLAERAILCPRNLDKDEINQDILDKVFAQKKVYLSIDRCIDQKDSMKYPVEFLNKLNPPDVPVHYLQLKVGVPVMLLRNMDPPMLCNGTRLQVTGLHDNIVQATILTGEYLGEKVIIPRIPINPTGYPFSFQRKQFPLTVSFSMTINKSQGQTFKKVK